MTSGPSTTNPEAFSTDELRDLARTWPMFAEVRLPKNATVVIAGAYKGKLIEFMVEAFPQIKHIYGFEPTVWAWTAARERLKALRADNKAWSMGANLTGHVYRFGLLADYSTDVHELPMFEFETDAQSLIENTDHPDKPQGTGLFVGVEEGLSVVDGDIDLFILNMEGYEWKLLPFMFDRLLLGRIKSLAVQFHGYARREANAIDVIALSSILDDVYGKPLYYQYPQWVYWRRRSV